MVWFHFWVNYSFIYYQHKKKSLYMHAEKNSFLFKVFKALVPLTLTREFSRTTITLTLTSAKPWEKPSPPSAATPPARGHTNTITITNPPHIKHAFIEISVKNKLSVIMHESNRCSWNTEIKEFREICSSWVS